MEPVTHVLTGVCLARCGLNRRAAYTTAAMAIAAEFPDIDTLWSLGGPVAGFTHHRGITHTFLGLPFEAALITAAFYVLHQWRTHREKRRSSAEGASLTKPLTQAPVNWWLLYGFCLLALLSHLFLDYTNNYGLRPFFPFDPRWYAGSFVFIFDPLLFALLLLPVVFPPLFALIGSEVGSRKKVFRGRGWAMTALALIVAFWGLRVVEHRQATTLAMAESMEAPAETQAVGAPGSAGPDDSLPLPTPPPPLYMQPVRVSVNPDPLSVFRWHTVMDFGAFYRLADVDTARGESVYDPQVLAKPLRTPEILAAEASPLGRAYLDWSAMPIIVANRDLPILQNAAPGTAAVVSFRDPRFMGDVVFLRSQENAPLTGKVDLNASNQLLQQSMDGRIQK